MGLAKFVKVKSIDGHQNRVPSNQSALCCRVCITTLFSFLLFLSIFFQSSRSLHLHIYRQLKLHHISVISLVRARTVYSCDATRQLSSKESGGSANECLVFFSRVDKVIWPLKRDPSPDALLICPRIIVSCHTVSACKEVKRDLSSNPNAHACIPCVSFHL